MTTSGNGSSQAVEEDKNYILYECADQIATITLNRPRVLNAFNDEMVVQLGDALARFDLDPDANVAIIRGAGRAFSSGADVRQRQLRPRAEMEAQGGHPAARNAKSEDLFTRAVNWKPVIAAPHGYAIGMSLGLCLDCEMIVAEAGTKFQITEVARGLGGARYYTLMDFRGAGSLAVDAGVTGRFFTAEEAHVANMVDRVAPAGQGYEHALELARQINANPPLSARQTVRVRRYLLDKINREVLLYTRALKLALTEDFHESARAFAEKRKPAAWKGR